MGGKALTAPLDSRLLGDQVDVRGDGSTCFYRALDSGLEVSGHIGSVLEQYLEHTVTNEVEILSWVDAEHVEDTGRVEVDRESVEA